MANAAPSTPHLNPQTNKISRPILTNVEIIRKISGVIESPIALKSPAQTLYNIAPVIPKRIILKYLYAPSIRFSGVFKNSSIFLKNATLSTVNTSDTAIPSTKVADTAFFIPFSSFAP